MWIKGQPTKPVTTALSLMAPVDGDILSVPKEIYAHTSRYTN